MLDIEFPEEIVRTADNSRLVAAWQLLRPQLLFWLASMQRIHAAVFSGTQSEAALSHRELLNTLQSGDAERCEHFARRHANGLRQLLDSLTEVAK
jgi:DNA-binding GntR family transcriptional regulator